MKTRLLAVILALILCLGCLAGCSKAPPADSQTPEAPGTREFTDSVGRTVTIPNEVKTIAVSGPLTQVYVLPLAGDMMVGVSNAFSDDAEEYLPGYIFELPELGQLYGGKEEMDLEALLTAAPDVVIDVGEAKGGIAEDLDALTEQTNIPFIHIDATVETAPAAYRLLGELLGREAQAEALAKYCEDTYADATAMMARVDADGARKTALYCLGDKGTNVMASGSFHADTINFMTENLAVVEEVVSKGSGNEVDLEQIIVWNPEVIVFDPASVYDEVGADPAWQSVKAVADGNYFETPYGPYGWLSSPPAVQRYLGILWLGAVLYPDYIDYDLQERVTEYYKLFYGCELTNEMYQDLIEDAMPR